MLLPAETWTPPKVTSTRSTKESILLGRRPSPPAVVIAPSKWRAKVLKFTKLFAGKVILIILLAFALLLPCGSKRKTFEENPERRSRK